MKIEKIIKDEFSLLGDGIAEILINIELLISELKTELSAKDNIILDPAYIDELAEKFDHLLLERYQAIISKTDKLTMQTKSEDQVEFEHIDYDIKT